MPDSPAPPDFAPSARSRVRRHPERAHYDRDTVFAILDSSLLAHIGYVIDGLPYVTPTLFWREGERLYWHGSSASRMLRSQAAGIRLGHRQPCRRAGAGALGLPPLAQLPRGDGLRPRPRWCTTAAEGGRDQRLRQRLYPADRADARVLAQEIKATALMTW